MILERKHAYLIIAHNQFDILEKLIKLLDYPLNDIFIHIDKSVKNFNFNYYKKLGKYSNIIFCERINVKWAHFSQVEATIELLKSATKGNYAYYHLLSGVDLPIKPPQYIHNFFKDYTETEFIYFASDKEVERIKSRVLHYHFIRYHRHEYYCMRCFGKCFNKILEKLQFILRFERRWDENISLKFGSNWWSITHNLATYILSNEKWIRKTFKYARNADELFLQTLVFNSEFKNAVYMKDKKDTYDSILRCIDFERGNPYTFTSEDLLYLKNSSQLFARKFDSIRSKQIVEEVYEFIQSEINKIKEQGVDY